MPTLEPLTPLMSAWTFECKMSFAVGCEAQAQQQVCVCDGHVVLKDAQTVHKLFIRITPKRNRRMMPIMITKTYATLINSVFVSVVESESTGNRNLIVGCETQAGFEVLSPAFHVFPWTSSSVLEEPTFSMSAVSMNPNKAGVSFSGENR